MTNPAPCQPLDGGACSERPMAERRDGDEWRPLCIEHARAAKAAGAEVRSSVQLQIEPSRLFCRVHGEYFRAQWPKGVTSLIVATIEELFSKPDSSLWADVDRMAVERGVEGDELARAELVEVALDDRQACCRLGTKRMIRVYHDAKLLVRKRCSVCGRRRFGAPFETTHQSFRHLGICCFTANLQRMN